MVCEMMLAQRVRCKCNDFLSKKMADFFFFYLTLKCYSTHRFFLLSFWNYHQSNAVFSSFFFFLSSSPPDNLSIEEFQRNESIDVEVSGGRRELSL